MSITITVTDRNLNVVGDPVAGWSDLDVVGRWNEPWSASFTAPATPDLLDQLQPGNRVVVMRDRQIFTSGPIEKPGPYVWEAGSAENGGPGKITVHFADDLALVAGRVVYPDPAQPSTNQATVAAWTSTANAEVLMRNLVNLNAGPGALAVRQIPKLVLGTLQGVGTSITVTSRFGALCDELRTAATAGGRLGFRTRQVGTNIEFQVYAPVDRSATVRFSRGLGTLRGINYDPEAPATTVAIVGGQGEGTARTIREVVGAGAATWWRLEKFIDQRQTNVVAELDAAGAETLATDGESVKLATVTVDTEDIRYGRDYQLGDRVPVELYQGVTPITDVVRQIHLTATPDKGETLTSLIGTQDATRDPAWLQVGRDLQRRLGRVERR